MKSFPTTPMAQHSLFIDALCQDWREAGTVTRVTPRADAVIEISRQLSEGDCSSSTVAGAPSGLSRDASQAQPPIDYRKGGVR